MSPLSVETTQAKDGKVLRDPGMGNIQQTAVGKAYCCFITIAIGDHHHDKLNRMHMLRAQLQARFGKSRTLTTICESY